MLVRDIMKHGLSNISGDANDAAAIAHALPGSCL